MYESLAKGLAIYRQNHTKSIYVRLRIDGKELKRSLRTSDVEQAKANAWALKFELEGMVMAGMTIETTKKHSIEKACNEVIKQLESRKPQKAIYKDYILVFKSFIIPYFKRKSIDELTTKNIRLYFESLELSKTRKTINKTCFTKLFEYLEEEELLSKRDFPTLPKDIKTAQKQIGVDFKEKDLEIIEKYLSSSDYQNQSGLKSISKEYRQLMPHVFSFLLNTGIRTGEEMNNILFSNIYKEKNNFYVKIEKGKTKEHHQRDVLLNRQAIKALVEIISIVNGKDLTQKNLLTGKKELVFSSSNNKVAGFDKIFEQAIKALIKDNKIKTKYTLYSCRHTYITNMLLNNVDMFVIAKQVGNSLEMIQKHYDHSLLKDNKNIDALNHKPNPIFDF